MCQQLQLRWSWHCPQTLSCPKKIVSKCLPPLSHVVSKTIVQLYLHLLSSRCFQGGPSCHFCLGGADGSTKQVTMEARWVQMCADKIWDQGNTCGWPTCGYLDPGLFGGGANSLLGGWRIKRKLQEHHHGSSCSLPASHWCSCQTSTDDGGRWQLHNGRHHSWVRVIHIWQSSTTFGVIGNFH